ncbi:hypothetical protein ACQKOF_18235, partial [Lysinibacillus sp. NPDC093190]|uniref:hypothetical protein n=1 Tax=Lysinibacillus sp. NPDC093190 TaxID=3390575 RepID=UPI003D02060E
FFPSLRLFFPSLGSFFPSLCFLSVTLALLSVALFPIRRLGSSSRRSDLFRHFDSSIRHFANVYQKRIKKNVQ